MPTLPADAPILFALGSTRPLGMAIAQALGVPVAEHEERDFEDGEHTIRPLVDVQGRHACVVHSLHGDTERGVHDKLIRMLFFLGAVRDAGARHVTAVVPYLCYARKDRKTHPGDPVTTRYVARLFESVGVDRVLTMDVHNPSAYENAFRVPTGHLTAGELFADHFHGCLGEGRVAVVSPDSGGVKRAEAFRRTLAGRLQREVPLVFAEKHRSRDGLRGEALVGDVHGATAIVLDDLIATGSTLVRAAQSCRDHGATAVFAAATHGLFVGDAPRTLDTDLLDGIVVTDTVPPFRLDAGLQRRRLTVRPTAPAWAQAIRHLDGG
jgi:ribose-phosphate pyrophosphokinase